MLNKKNYEPQKFDSIRHMMQLAVEQAGDKVAYMWRGSDGSDNSVTFAEFYDTTENLGAMLTKLGYGSAHIACLGENSYDWICVYLTALKSAGVFVPIDKELPTSGKLHVLTDGEAEVLFFSSKYEKWVRENMASLPGISLFVCFGAEEDDGNILSYKKMINDGASVDKTDYDALKSDYDDLKLLVYTSGTTGIAKGVMLTEHNLCALIYNGLKVSQIYERGLSVLPYHHTYEAVCDILVSIHYHSTLCINRSLRDIVKDLQYYKPQYVYLVPAIAEFMYASILNGIKEQGKEEKLKKGLKISNNLLAIGIDVRRKLFKDLHELFGGNLIKIVCGGAPIRPEMGRFFASIGIYLTGGYGITECSPLVAVNHERTINHDTAGHRLPCIDWRIDDPDADGIGEICVKGETVMKGYYKQPEKTAEAIIDGWFHTGDYGYITPDDQVVITGRKKNIIVLSNGKNIYPEEIENYIQNLPEVKEVVVRGIKNDKGNETGLMAEVCLADKVEISESELLRIIQKALSELPSYKVVKQVVIRDTPFEKTSTNKIKR